MLPLYHQIQTTHIPTGSDKFNNLIFTTMTYFICYNGKYIASRKSLKTAVDYIDARGLQDDDRNELYIVDQRGNSFTQSGDAFDWM